jgi:hypothetical protein
MVGEGQANMYRERALAQARWEKENIANVLDAGSCSQPNPHYIKKELIDGKIVTSMPNIPEEVEEEQ